MFRTLKISQRTLLCFGIVALLLIALGGFNLLQMADIRRAGQVIESDSMPSLATADEIALSITRIRVEVLRLVANDDESVQAKSNDLIASLANQIKQKFRDYDGLMSDPREKEIVGTLEATFTQYMEILGNVQALIAQNNTEEASKVINTFLAPLGIKVNEQNLLLQSYNEEDAAEASQQAADSYSQARIVIFAIIFMALAATLILAFLLTTSIVKPIGQAVDVAKRIAAGDLSRSITIEGRDEATDLLNALSSMQTNLRSTIGQISDSAQQLSASAEEMSAVMEESTRGLQRQNDQIELAATAVNEMTAAVEDVASNAVNTSEASQASSQSAQEGRTQLSDAITSIEALTSEVLGASQSAEELAEQTRNISKVLDVIRAVAEQTNLLALNAAIEAARAGEAGRGFAVVADEVRALAHRTGESTREIEGMIGSIQQGTGQTVDALQKSAERARSTLEKANAAGEALSTITLNVADINDRNLLIASASEQQAQVAREVDRNLVSIRDLSVQTATGAQQTSAATQELTRLSVDLNGLVRRFSL
ncbi:methyl-accepting chemotaxis protein [Pseudomonas duriflava]|uniref:Methyl-accepting chemotaxis protein n=1 Tax=Pseudomonas duriflava TaxID=459528 RepID=A0A562QID1_9PSED|nr:methyl-accepting chemotaxis protein [Pseudomonas duriflava]TWI56528.1 methyl-accepting chemotaxis protein [Pseudomonas duriflava]